LSEEQFLPNKNGGILKNTLDKLVIKVSESDPCSLIFTFVVFDKFTYS